MINGPIDAHVEEMDAVVMDVRTDKDKSQMKAERKPRKVERKPQKAEIKSRNYIKVVLGVGALLCVALCANVTLAAFLASKETWVKGGVLADSDKHVVATAQAHAVVPIYVVIAMESAELARVKQLTVSYYSEEYGARTEVTIDIMRRQRVDNMTVVLEAFSGEKVVVHGGTAHLVLATGGAEVPVCGGNADCSSFKVRGRYRA